MEFYEIESVKKFVRKYGITLYRKPGKPEIYENTDTKNIESICALLDNDYKNFHGVYNGGISFLHYTECKPDYCFKINN